MTMPASQSMDYVALLRRLPEGGEPCLNDAEIDGVSSLAEHLTALGETDVGCGRSLNRNVKCGDYYAGTTIPLRCAECGMSLRETIHALTHTNPRDAHGR